MRIHTSLTSKIAAPLVLAAMVFMPLSSAQDVEPDDLGFILGTPDVLTPPEGRRSINIFGDPSKPGLYVIRITFQPGQGTQPHYHSTARYITVVKGTWYTAYGDGAEIYDPDNMVELPAGTFVYQPPGGVHYDMAKDEEVTVQIMGVGPVVTTAVPPPEVGRTYLNPQN